MIFRMDESDGDGSCFSCYLHLQYIGSIEIDIYCFINNLLRALEVYLPLENNTRISHAITMSSKYHVDLGHTRRQSKDLGHA